MRFRRILCSTVALISLAILFTGCAQQMQSVKEDSLVDVNGLAALQDIKISEDGFQVAISSNMPLTYTFYKVSSPLKVIIDISQTEPGAMKAPVESAAGAVKRVEVVRHGFGQNVLSRVEIALANDSEFTVATDPENKAKLLVNFARPASDRVVSKAVTVVEDKPLNQGNQLSVAPAESGNGKQAKAAEVQSTPVYQQPKVDEKQGRMEEKQAVQAAKDNPAFSSSRKARTVTAVNVANDGIEILADGGIDTFTTFKLANPARLVLDITGVKNGVSAKTVEIRKFGFDKARLGESPDKVRIVFDVTKASIPPYRVGKSERGLKIFLQGIVLAEPVTSSAAMAGEPVSQRVEVSGKVTHKTSMVEAIDFKPVEGYSQISVKVGGACAAEKPKKSAGRWALTIRNCQLPLNLQRVLDTSAFPSSVQEITPYQVRIKGGYETKIQVKVRSDIPFNFRQDGDTIYWSFKNPEGYEITAARPVGSNAVAASPRGKTAATVEREIPLDRQIPVIQTTDKKKVYTGRRVTLEFSDADVRKIFQLIADVSSLNFLIADDVSGTISLKLVNVPWDQALDVILDSKSLEMKRDGNIVQIKPRGKFKTQEQEEDEAKRDREKRMELVTRVFEVNFADIKDIEAKFKEFGSKFPGTSVISDSRTNKVIVVDNINRIKKMEELLAKIDSPEKQVMIEARIVEATSTFSRDLGVQWGIHYKDGSASVLGINQLDTGFGGILTQVPPAAGFQDFATPGGSMGLSFGKLTSNIQVDMRLSAAATAGLIKIISTPKVVTLNNKPAKISQGQSIPYQTTSAEGTKTQFVDATLSLEVTPHITSDGNIGMKITASNNSAANAPPGIAPAINKKEATTELQVMNGETTVIGGIYVDNDTELDSGVPFLMDIPLFGWLFKSNTRSKTKTELLIFITPRVVN
jgi:type IV pilus assembly protein PilQ